MSVRLATEFRGCATSVAWIRAEAGESVFGLIAGVCYASSGIRGAVFGASGMLRSIGGGNVHPWGMGESAVKCIDALGWVAKQSLQQSVTGLLR